MNISDNNKKIANNTIFLYFRMVITVIVSLFTVRVVFKALGVENYGIYNAVGGIILSMTFISKVLALASQRFFSISIGKNDINELRDNLTAIVVVYILLSLFIIIIAETVGLWFLNTHMTIPEDRLFAANITYQLTIVAFIITILSSPYQALIISYEEMKVFAYISILDVVLKLGIVVFLLIDFDADKLIVYSILMLFTTFTSNLVYYFYCKHFYPTIIDKLQWEWGQIKSILCYSSWTMFGTLSGVLSNQGVIILLNLFWGPIANAAFAIASQISNQVNMLAYNFFVAVRPSLTKSYVRDDKHYTKSLFYASTKMLFVLLFLILLPLYIETESILNLWIGSVKPYMVEFTHQMLLFVLILSLGNPITTIIQAAGVVKKYHVIVDGFTLLGFPTALLFIKLCCNVVTVFYILNVVFFIAHIIRIILLNQVAPYLSLRNCLRYLGLPFTIVATISIAISTYIKMQTGTGIISLLCTFICTTISIITLSYFVLLTKDEKNLVTNIIKKKTIHDK